MAPEPENKSKALFVGVISVMGEDEELSSGRIGGLSSL
jgi:hypothetical protein